jgi:hypothetical protein
VTITLKDFQGLANERIAEGLANPQQFHEKIKDILNFAVANEASMDAEANAHFDHLIGSIADTFEQGLSSVDDGPDKRRMLRAIAGVRRQHHRADAFLKRLGMPLPVPVPVAELAKPIFLEAQQSVLDLLWDVTRHSQEGAAQFATLSLLYWAFDELTVAFYLAERRYTTQAYAHLRTVHDLLNKAELFFHQPQWAEVWGSNDKKQIIRELSPKGVRKKLGKPGFDPVYGFFSELGTHGTFGAVQKRVTQTAKKENRTQVAMRIGGTPWDSEVRMAIACCVFTVLSTLLTIAKVYEIRLNFREVVSILRARFASAGQFLQKHFVEPAGNSGLDASAITETLKSLLTTLDGIAAESGHPAKAAKTS